MIKYHILEWIRSTYYPRPSRLFSRALNSPAMNWLIATQGDQRELDDPVIDAAWFSERVAKGVSDDLSDARYLRELRLRLAEVQQTCLDQINDPEGKGAATFAVVNRKIDQLSNQLHTRRQPMTADYHSQRVVDAGLTSSYRAE